MQFEDNTILIVPSSIKQKILLEINNLKKIINIKVYTINDFIHKYYFEYDKKTVCYVSKKYKVKPEIAKIYIDNLYYLNGNNSLEKIKFLNELYVDLLNKKLLKQNKMFKESLKNKKIVFVNIPKTKFNNNLFNSLKKDSEVIAKEILSNNKYNHVIKHFKTLEDEVVFAANKICELIKKGININKIYISNISEEHYLIIKKIFNIFNIPVTLKENNSIYGTKLVKKFINNYESDINKTLSLIESEINTTEDEKIYNSLINIINEYYFIEDFNEVKAAIINDLKETTIPMLSLENSIKEVSFLDYIFEEDEYVFLFNFNEGCFPKIHKDENFLSDKIMNELNLDTAPFLNKLEKNRIIKKINSTKNLFISYIDKSLSSSYYPSSLIDELKLTKEDFINKEYHNSNLYNKIKLASLFSNYQKYNIIDSSLPLLYNNYKLIKYDNRYSKINTNNLHKFLNNKLYLSYTSLNNYYKCGFKYYLSNILKLDIYEETFLQIIGDIFHEVLEKYFHYQTDFETLYNNAINNIDFDYSVKDKFFLNKLKEELKFVIETIENQNNYTNLKDELYEENIVVNITGNIEIKFSGKIDKLKYKKKDKKTIIAIIDYKTGNPELNINNVIYGLDMQLPIYIYLAQKSSKLENIEVAGFYLQKILNNEIVADNKHSYEQLKKDKLKLQGYSNSDYNIINEFDSSYMDSNVIKSLKVSSKGFYKYSKVLNSKQITELSNIIEKNIINGSNNILNANFDINPKVIDDDNIGCKYCNFKNVCYMTEKDTINYKKYKNLEFLGGDNNDQMD